MRVRSGSGNKRKKGVRTILSYDRVDVQYYDIDVSDCESIGEEFSNTRRAWEDKCV